MKKKFCPGSGSAFYGFGFIGSLVYFLLTAVSFWDGLYGIFQAIFWPAYFAFYAFESFLG